MVRSSFVPLVLAVLAITAAPVVSEAQVLGTFTWQMQPFCNRLTLTLTTTPGGFAAVGADDQCGAPKKAGATGAVTFNPDGTVGIALVIVPPAGGTSVDVVAVVSPASGQGTWADSVGNGGTFALGGATSGLPVRPLGMAPLDVADNPRGMTDPCFDSPPVELTQRRRTSAGGPWSSSTVPKCRGGTASS